MMEKVAEAWATEMRRGHTKLAVLTILSKESLTGYDLMKKIEESTFGFWRITPGGVYPILRELEKKSYIKGTRKPEDSRRKKIYEITDEGKTLLKTAIQKQQQIAQTMRDLMSEYARDILNTELPDNLPALPPNIFSMVNYLKKETIEVQTRILTKTRERMLNLITRIDERIAQIAAEKAIK
jgi:DNA-binding PadR family transcriptional regulator